MTRELCQHMGADRYREVDVSRRMLLVFICLATALNVGILVLNLSSKSAADVAGLDQQGLLKDSDFVGAVRAIVEACSVNVDTAKVKC